jgi:hypothetical protein
LIAEEAAEEMSRRGIGAGGAVLVALAEGIVCCLTADHDSFSICAPEGGCTLVMIITSALVTHSETSQKGPLHQRRHSAEDDSSTLSDGRN